MTTCCARLSKWYMLTTNTLFFCLGVAFLSLGVIGKRDGFYGASLFPPNTFKNLVILGVIIVVVSVIGAIGAFVRNRWLIYTYMLIILASLVFQVMIGVQVYQKAANRASYLSDIWTFSSYPYRSNLQEQFDCCGFQTIGDTCPITTTQSCASSLQSYVKKNFSKMYYVLFAALSFQVLALSNAITIICAGTSTEDDNDDNILFDDTFSDKENLMYNHSNFSNKFSEAYDGPTIHNNRHGN